MIRCLDCGSERPEQADPLHRCDSCGAAFVIVQVAAGPWRIRTTSLLRGSALTAELDRLAGGAS